MKNYVQPGDRLAIYNSSSTATLLAGVPVVVSGHIRIPIANISPLSWGEASAEEVFNLPAKASDTWNDGDTLYWDPNNGWLTSNGEAAGVVLAGASVPMSVSVAGQQTVTAGKAAGVTSANVELIDHNAEAIIPQAAITQLQGTLTDSSGGTAGTTLAAVTAGATYAQADIVALKNSVSSLAAQLNKAQTDMANVLAALAAAGVIA